MSRRFGRRNARGGNAGGGGAPVLSTTGLVANWRGDRNVVAGATQTWTDSVNGYVLSQGSAANQLTPVTPTELGSKAALSADGSNDRMVCTAPASTFKFLHDGTGYTVQIIGVSRSAFNTLNAVMSTSTITTTDYGALFGYWGPATNLAALYTVRGVAGRTITSEPALGGSITGLASALDYTYLEGGSPEFNVRRNGVSLANGSSANAPDTSNNPTYALHIGCTGAAGNFAAFDYTEIAIYNKALTAGERAQNTAYYLARYGVAA